jgi:hypothetical protein
VAARKQKPAATGLVNSIPTIVAASKPRNRLATHLLLKKSGAHVDPSGRDKRERDTALDAQYELQAAVSGRRKRSRDDE